MQLFTHTIWKFFQYFEDLEPAYTFFSIKLLLLLMEVKSGAASISLPKESLVCDKELITAVEE